MVDWTLLQPVSYFAAALSVVLYIANLLISGRREERNRRIALTNNMLQTFISKEFQLDLGRLLNFTWSDDDDFVRKYDSKADEEKAALRNSTFFKFNTLGYMLREGLVEPDLVYRTGGWMSIWLWVKFYEVVYLWRRITSSGYCVDFEYLAREMWKIMKVKDPAFVTDQTQFPAGAYGKAFAPPQ